VLVRRIGPGGSADVEAPRCERGPRTRGPRLHLDRRRVTVRPGTHGGAPEALAVLRTPRHGAAAMAAICAEVSARSADVPIPPLLLSMALWMLLADDPFFPLPWHPAQYWL
jgi:hypothetical protein